MSTGKILRSWSGPIGAVAAVAVVLGCGSDIPGAPQPTTPTIEALGNNTFSPSTLTVGTGETVRWQNVAGFHNVMAQDSTVRCAFGCDSQGGDGTPSGGAWSFTVEMSLPGNFNYLCEVHESGGMRGTVIVQ